MKILLQIDDQKARTWRERLGAEFPDDDVRPGVQRGLAPLIVKAVDTFVLVQILGEPATVPTAVPSKRKSKVKDAPK